MTTSDSHEFDKDTKVKCTKVKGSLQSYKGTRDVTSTIFWGCQRMPCEKFLSVTQDPISQLLSLKCHFLVTVVDQ